MQTLTCPLREISKLNDDVWEFYFEFPEPMQFQAGQFFMIKIPSDPPQNRSYSVSSPPNTKGFKLCVKLLPDGLGSNYLRNLKIGDEIECMGPAGHFTLKDSNKDIIMVATGTGLAPFMSMLPIILQKGSGQNIRLYFGCRHQEDLFYFEKLSKWEEEYENFKVITCLSKAKENWQGSHGRVTDLLIQDEIDPENTKVYICGNGNMVKDVRNMMIKKGLDKNDIHFELFTPIV